MFNATKPIHQKYNGCCSSWFKQIVTSSVKAETPLLMQVQQLSKYYAWMLLPRATNALQNVCGFVRTSRGMNPAIQKVHDHVCKLINPCDHTPQSSTTPTMSAQPPNESKDAEKKMSKTEKSQTIEPHFKKLHNASKKIEEIMSSSCSEHEKIQQMRKIAEEHHHLLKDSFSRRIASLLFVLGDVSSKAIGTCLLRAFDKVSRDPLTAIDESDEDPVMQILNFRESVNNRSALLHIRGVLPGAYKGKNTYNAEERKWETYFSYEQQIKEDISTDPELFKEFNRALICLNALTTATRKDPFVLTVSDEEKELASKRARQIFYGTSKLPTTRKELSDWEEKRTATGISNYLMTVCCRKGQSVSLTEIASKLKNKLGILGLECNHLILFEYFDSKTYQEMIIAATDNKDLTKEIINDSLVEINYKNFVVDQVIVINSRELQN